MPVLGHPECDDSGGSRSRAQVTDLKLNGGQHPLLGVAEREPRGSRWRTRRKCESVFAVLVWTRAGCEIRTFEPRLSESQRAKLAQSDIGVGHNI